jgi:signal transduction histidine kinase
MVSGGGAASRAGGADGDPDLRELRPPWTKRLRPRHWVALDCVIAVVFAALFVASSTQPAYGIPTWVAGLLALVATLPVAVRRYWPLPVLCIVLAASVAAMAIGTGKDPSIMVALAIYIVALRLPRRTAVAALACSLSLTVAGFVAGAWARQGDAGAGASRVAASVVVISAAWTLGIAVRQQRAYTAGLREQAERRAQAQVAEGRRALTQERLRIARELHDIVAHSMSLIAVQAGVGSYVAGSRPDEAARALSSIETTSRGALRDMRRLLGVLRDDDPAGPDLQPAHGLGDLGDLIGATAAAGVKVRLEVRGTQRSLPPGVDLAAYRIVQEALTNVVKHAGTASGHVVITYEEDALAVEITDNGRGAAAAAVAEGPGHGIAGMRERAVLYAGEFSAGPLPGRGFRVAARLLLDGATGEPARNGAT